MLEGVDSHFEASKFILKCIFLKVTTNSISMLSVWISRIFRIIKAELLCNLRACFQETKFSFEGKCARWESDFAGGRRAGCEARRNSRALTHTRREEDKKDSSAVQFAFQSGLLCASLSFIIRPEGSAYAPRPRFTWVRAQNFHPLHHKALDLGLTPAALFAPGCVVCVNPGDIFHPLYFRVFASSTASKYEGRSQFLLNAQLLERRESDSLPLVSRPRARKWNAAEACAVLPKRRTT